MAKGVTIVIQGDGESAKKALEMVRENLQATGEEAKIESSKIVEAAESIKGAFEMAGVYIGLREGIDLMKEMVGSSVELGMEIGHMSKETGISAQNLSVLKYAADVTGISFEALSKGSLKLSKDMLDAEEGKKQAILSFQRLGITQDEVKQKSGDLYGMLGLIADRFEKIPDGPQKAAAAIGIFGKAGAALIPFLDQGSAGIEELRGQAEALGIVLDEAGVQRMEQLHEESARLKGGLEGLSLQITQGLTPALLQVGESFQVATGDVKNFEAIGETLGVGVKILVTLFDFLSVAIKQTEGALFLLGAEAIDTVELAANAASAVARAAADPAHAIDILGAAKLKVDANLQEMQTDFKSTMGVISGDGAQFAGEMKAIWDSSTHPGPKPPKHAGGDGETVTPGDQSGKTPHSDDAIARARTGLAEANATAQADAVRTANTRILAELEAGHKAFLVSDQDFYQMQILIEKDSLDAQVNSLKTKQGELQELYAKQHSDKNLKRDKGGASAEELKTQTELVQLGQKLNDLAEKRATLDAGYDISGQVRAEEVRLNTLKMAAAVEEQTNGSIQARLALLRAENEEELKKISATAGEGSPEYKQAQALEQLKEAKLQIGEVNRQITATEDDYKRAVEELNDAAEKNPRLKSAATQQINQLNAQEAAQLQQLVAEYDALAAVLGGEYLNAAKNLHAELDKLNRPDEKQDSAFQKSLVTGVEDMAKRIGDASLSSKRNFHQMVEDMEKDALNLALKLAEEKWITPMMMGTGGAKLPSVNPGLGSAAVAGLGSAAPAPTGQKGTGSPVENVFKQILGGSAGGSDSAPKVTVVIENGTGQPVTAQTTSSSWDSDAKEFIVHTIITEASQGGALTQMFRGFGAG